MIFEAERARLLEVLQAQQTHHYTARIIENTPALICGITLEGITTFVNPAVEKTTGYSAEELIGRNWWKLVYPGAAYTQLECLFERLKTENKVHDYEMTLITASGKPAIVSWSYSNHLDESGNLVEIMGFGNDITAQKKAGEETKRLTLQREALMNNIPHIAWMKDLNSVYIAVNEPLARSCNRKPEEMVGKTDMDIWSAPLAEKYRRDDQEVLNRGERVVVEEEFKDSDGSTHWIETIKTPIRNEAGEFYGTVGIARDITSRKEMEDALKKANTQLQAELTERKLIEKQLVQSQKMESLGQLVSGIAHEINNPVGYVQSNMTTLCEYVDLFKLLLHLYHQLLDASDAERPQLIAKIRQLEDQEDLSYVMEDINGLLLESSDGMNRVREIIQGLKTFARADDSELVKADLNECLERTLRVVWNELKYKCTIIRDFGDIPQLECYPGQMNQVFMNLLVNAAQAIEDFGQIIVRTYATSDAIVIEIADNGQGISPENLDNIFNPFFTTKPVGQGTGLGLSISYGIIQKHQGTIQVQSQIGMGTSFTITLPLPAKKALSRRNTEKKGAYA